MLLEYNVDTKDENMKPIAIELRRRVAGRHLNDALAGGTIDSDTLVQMKERSRDERKTHLQEGLTISNAALNERISIARANQQLRAEGQLKVLGRDVARASRLSKSKYDVLTDLQRRIEVMRGQLKDPTDPPIETVINKELHTNDKLQLESKFGICQICDRRILLALLGNHITMCERRKHEQFPPKISLDDHATKSKHLNAKKNAKKKLTDEELLELEEESYKRPPVYDVDQTVLTAVATFPPQPPRQCVVVGKGATYIDWQWLPPVIDGGLAVTDYEIAYTGRHTLFDKSIGRYQHWETEDSLLTSRFCFQHNAIAHTGYRLNGLRAGSEYTHFKVRCCNLRGWSDWVEMLQDEEDPMQKMLREQQKNAASGSDGVFALEMQSPKKDVMSLAEGQTTTNGGAETFLERQKRERLSVGKLVTTHEPESPTPPLFVNCNLITSSCVHLDWSAPYYDGGVPIVDYIVHYTVMELQTTVTARNVLFEHVRSFKIHNTETQAVIRNIPPNTDVVKVYIIALNEVGLVSPKGNLKQPVCRTIETSRHGQLARELEAAAATVGEYFDSDFFTGVRQRLNRVEHMRQLSEELAVTPTDLIEDEEEKEWSAVLELQRIKAEAAEAERLRQEQLNLSDNEEETEKELLASKNSYIFTMRQRRAHYKRKLFALDKQIRDLKKERMDIDANRTKYTLEMRSKEKMLLSFKLEVERLRQYTGQTVTSSVLAGFNMQYKTSDYTQRINKAFETTLEEIANIKYLVITGENRRVKAKQELDATEEHKQERTAKFHNFEMQYQRTSKMLQKMNNTEDDTHRLYAKYFEGFVSYRTARRRFRNKVSDLFMHVIFRYQKSAFLKWKHGEYQATSSTDTARFASKGGVMLEQAAEKRIELQLLLREAISNTAAIKQKIDLSALSRDRQKRLVSSQDFKGMEEGIDITDLYHMRGIKMLYEGDGYAKLNKFDQAKHMYEAQIMWIRSRPSTDIKTLAICHGRLGRMFLKLGKQNRAIVEFDRQLSLAREISDKPEEADAFFGLGSGYLVNCDYENAVRYLNIAQTLLNGLGSATKYSAALRALKECYDRMNRPDKMQICIDRLQEMDGELSEKIALANFKISDMKARLVHTAAEIEHIVNIERTTFRAMTLKGMIRERELLLEQLEAELADQNAKLAAIRAVLSAIDAELAEAKECDEPEMWSVLVHDQPQVVEVEELKIRLAARSRNELQTLELEELAAKNIAVKIKNAENDIAGADEQLVLEEGPLMKHSRLDRPFRSIALCAANAAGNEVTGTGTGGYEEFAAAEGQHIHMIDYHSGSVNHVYMGGSEDLGHTGVVTCLLHDGKLIFSGSTDEKIIAWDSSELRTRVRIFLGHEGSIVSLAAEGTMLASGGSDSTLRLWDKHTGQQLRIVYGHSRSVLSMEIGPSWMLTGSMDTEVRVWKISRTKKHSLHVECTYRLIGHETAVTCVRYGAMEVLSGDTKGRIFIWWMKTGQILRKCQVHDGPVKCMQFDALHIVSGGCDNSVAITDIATGEVMQTLRGHTGHVIALAFDSERIISISGDNTVRYWQWGQQSAPTDKVHVLDKGETLLSVAKRYSITVEEVMRWNGVTDVRQCFAGMKLIVRKADPDAPTDAEKLLIQKEKRLEGGAKLAEKIAKDSAAMDSMLEEGAKLAKYNRVHKIATDIDFFSLGNRLFGAEKRQLELFPDKINPNENTRSLAGRFRAEDERKKEEIRRQGKGISDFDAPTENEEDAAALAWALKTGSKVRPRYFISADNEDEWGEVADALGVVMLQMMIEYEAYSVVMEQKRTLRSKQSVIGRINTQQQAIEEEKQLKLAEEKAHEKALLEAAGFKPLGDGVTADAATRPRDEKQVVLPPLNKHHSMQSQDSTVSLLSKRQESAVSVQSATSQSTDADGDGEHHMTTAAKAKARKAKRAADNALKKIAFKENVLRQASQASLRGAFVNSSSGDADKDPEMGEAVIVHDDDLGGGAGPSILHTTYPVPEIGEEDTNEVPGAAAPPAAAAPTSARSILPGVSAVTVPTPRESAPRTADHSEPSSPKKLNRSASQRSVSFRDDVEKFTLPPI